MMSNFLIICYFYFKKQLLNILNNLFVVLFVIWIFLYILTLFIKKLNINLLKKFFENFRFEINLCKIFLTLISLINFKF